VLLTRCEGIMVGAGQRPPANSFEGIETQPSLRFFSLGAALMIMPMLKRSPRPGVSVVRGGRRRTPARSMTPAKRLPVRFAGPGCITPAVGSPVVERYRVCQRASRLSAATVSLIPANQKGSHRRKEQPLGGP